MSIVNMMSPMVQNQQIKDLSLDHPNLDQSQNPDHQKNPKTNNPQQKTTQLKNRVVSPTQEQT